MPSIAHAETHRDVGTELVREWHTEGEPKAYVVLVHGLAEHSGRHERAGSLLAASGYAVRSFDLLGAGGTGGPRWDIADFGRLHDQIGAHLAVVRAHGKPVVLMGQSLGGLLALGYVLSARPKPDLLVLSAPALAGGAAWQRAAAPVVGRMLPGLVLPNGIKGEYLSRDLTVGEAYFADPMVIPKTSARMGAAIFREIDRVNGQLETLDVPTLVFLGGEDPVIPPVSSEPLGELECVERKVYEGLRHETMNEPEGPQVVADLVAWLDRHV